MLFCIFDMFLSSRPSRNFLCCDKTFHMFFFSYFALSIFHSWILLFWKNIFCCWILLFCSWVFFTLGYCYFARIFFPLGYCYFARIFFTLGYCYFATMEKEAQVHRGSSGHRTGLHSSPKVIHVAMALLVMVMMMGSLMMVSVIMMAMMAVTFICFLCIDHCNGGGQR